ncbi:MAG: hypothetical protein ACK55X_09335 [Synechococcaceae cyanobacterium]
MGPPATVIGRSGAGPAAPAVALAAVLVGGVSGTASHPWSPSSAVASGPLTGPEAISRALADRRGDAAVKNQENSAAAMAVRRPQRQ